MDDEVKNRVEVKENMRVVTTNNLITAKGLEKLSIKARKLLYVAITMCKKNDKEFYEFEISIDEFAKLMGISRQAVYKDADRITDELMTGFISAIPDGETRFEKYSIFSKCKYDHQNGISFKLNPDMTEFLLQLRADFSQPLINDFMRMRSQYSMAIWHLMQREMHSKKPRIDGNIEFFLSVDEIRSITGTEEKLKQIGELKKRVFDKALREIEENCGVKIEYSNVKRGHTIVGFKCVATSAWRVKLDKDKKDMIKLRALSCRIKSGELISTEEYKEYLQLIEEAEEKNIDLKTLGISVD